MFIQGFPGGSDKKESACNEGGLGLIPGFGRSPGEPTSVFLPGKSLWTEEPGGLPPMWSQRVGHDWVAKHSTAQLYVIIIIRYYYI